LLTMLRPEHEDGETARETEAKLKPLSEGLRHYRTLWGLSQEEVARRMRLKSNELVSRREYPPGHPRGIMPTVEELGLLETSQGVPRGTILRWCGWIEDAATWRDQVRSWPFLDEPMKTALIAQIGALEALAAERGTPERRVGRPRSTRRTRAADAYAAKAPPVED
jgi:hypothetical protein